MNKDFKFGAFLKEQRKNVGLSQYQLGMLLGVSDRAVSKWENGLSKPNSKLLLKISEILCMSTDELLEANLMQNEMVQSRIQKKNREIWQRLHNIITERYGVCPAIEVVSRFEKERNAFADSGLIQVFNLFALLKEEAKRKQNKIEVMGGIGTSFIAFIFGITDINPLPPHYYCYNCKIAKFVTDVCDGWDLPQKKCTCCGRKLKRDGHNLPFDVYRHVISDRAGFDIVINKEFYNTAEQFIISNMENYSLTVLENPYVLCQGKMVSDAITFVIEPVDKRRRIRKIAVQPTINECMEIFSKKSYINLMFDEDFEKIIKLERLVNQSYENVNFQDERILQLLLASSINDKSFMLNDKFCVLLKQYTVNTFDNLIHVFGMLMLFQLDPGIIEELYINLYSLDQVIVYRDDLFNLISSKLRERGCYDTDIAYGVMNRARKGIYYRKGMDEATRNLLMEIGLSKEFIVFLESVRYMFNKAVGITYLEKEMKLMWYRVHYPEEFSHLFLE